MFKKRAITLTDKKFKKRGFYRENENRKIQREERVFQFYLLE